MFDIVSSARQRIDVEFLADIALAIRACIPTSRPGKLLLQQNTSRFTGAFNYEHTSSS